MSELAAGASPTHASAAPSAAATGQSRKRQRRERLIAFLVQCVGLTGIAAVVLIFVFVGKETLPLVLDPATREEASFAKMFTPQVARAGKPATFTWQPVSGKPKVSMVPLFVGTLKVTAIAMLFAVPFGIAAALFSTQFASRRLREWLKPVLELLAGIPSVVLGFFALMVLATFVQETFHTTYRLNGLVAGIGLALAIVPVIFTVSEDALTAVPKSYREASLALGANRWQTAWRVMLPAATPGILAACVLGFGRAIGETMIVLMASGNAAVVSASLTDSVRTLSATIAAEMGEVVVGSPHYTVLFFIGIELFLFTFVLNLIAAFWVRSLQRRSTGAGGRR